MTGSRLYFGYGSNLNDADRRKWCDDWRFPGATLTPLSTATLPDHELAFAYKSSSRAGGALDVRPRMGQLVDGVLFEVDDKGWQALDAKEGVSTGRYERFETLVIDAVGNEVPAISYRVTQAHRQDYVKPPSDYVDIVSAGLRAHGLPDVQLRAAAANETPTFRVDAFFVYGTLMRGECRFPALEQFGLQCILLARAFGRLLDLGAFPGMVEEAGADKLVEGEFIRVADVEGATRALDVIEGFNGFGKPDSLYRRKLIQVDVGDARIRRAWTYLYAGDRGSASAIQPADWRRHVGRRDTFLAALAAAHASGQEERMADLITQTYPHAMAENRAAAARSLLPLTDALRRGEISERHLAQASGRWAVIP